MTEIRLLAVPYEVGAPRMGVGRGPDRLLEAGAEEALSSHGARVRVEQVELQEHERDRSGASEAGGAFELIGLVAIAGEGGDRRRPLPGAPLRQLLRWNRRRQRPRRALAGSVWFDAHGDFNTPDTSVDGYFDGMGVAILTGAAWRAMVEGVGGTTILESAVVLAGARDFDELEEKRLSSSEVVQMPPGSIGSEDAIAAVVSEMAPAPTAVYLHVDLDVLESQEAPVNIYSVTGGLSAAQLEAQVRSLLDACPVRAFSLTSYDPEVDADGRVPPIVLRLLELVADHVARER